MLVLLLYLQLFKALCLNSVSTLKDLQNSLNMEIYHGGGGGGAWKYFEKPLVI